MDDKLKLGIVTAIAGAVAAVGTLALTGFLSKGKSAAA